MRPARRLAELTRFLEDRSLLEVAQLAADALAGLSPEELQQLRDAPGGEAGAPYADLYDIYWNEWVEPQAPHSVNADYEGDHAELVLWMSYQGVVIDHLIRLRMEPADMWWDRATDLVAHHPAQPFPIN